MARYLPERFPMTLESSFTTNHSALTGCGEFFWSGNPVLYGEKLFRIYSSALLSSLVLFLVHRRGYS